MAALLRLAAMLVESAVSSLRMLLTLLPRECHTDVERDRLPAMEDGTRKKETQTAATHSHSPEALMLRDRRTAPIVSKHAGGLTSPFVQHGDLQPISPLILAKARTNREKLLGKPRP